MNTSAKKRTAFTLIELLVVIAIIAILAAMLLPALARAKLQSMTAYCLNNQKQLMLSWKMYADDNRDFIVGADCGSNSDWRIDPSSSFFVMPAPIPAGDNVSGGAQNEWLDQQGFLQGALARYCPNPAVIHCPADKRSYLGGANYAYDSYSIAEFLNGSPSPAARGPGVIVKQSDLQHPSDRFVWLEENDPRPETTSQGFTVYENEGGWELKVNDVVAPISAANGQNVAWYDCPAAYHVTSETFSFVDGHAINHGWRDAATLFIANYDGLSPSKPTVAETISVTLSSSPAPPGGSPHDLPWVVNDYPWGSYPGNAGNY